MWTIKVNSFTFMHAQTQILISPTKIDVKNLQSPTLVWGDKIDYKTVLNFVLINFLPVACY